MYHLGVVKCLFEQKCLPSIVCGTAIGALVAGMLGVGTAVCCGRVLWPCAVAVCCDRVLWPWTVAVGCGCALSVASVRCDLEPGTARWGCTRPCRWWKQCQGDTLTLSTTDKRWSLIHMQWGAPLWTAMEMYAQLYPFSADAGKQAEAVAYFRPKGIVSSSIPCGKCSHHFDEYAAATPAAVGGA